MSYSKNLPQTISGSLEVPGTDVLSSQRACDADRNRVIDHLAECHKMGHIPNDVFQARLATAADAVTHTQLTEMLADLPALAPLRIPWHQRVRAAADQVAMRRWLHIAGALGALCIMIVVPAVIYAVTAFQVQFSAPGQGTWLQTEHTGMMISLFWFTAVVGLVLLAADIAWWGAWESRNSE